MTPKPLKIAEIILLIVVVLGVGGWWLMKKPAQVAQPSPTPIVDVDTTGWKTYQNTKYGFEFRYPADLSIGEDNIEESGKIIGVSVDVESHYNVAFSVSVNPLKHGLCEGSNDVQANYVILSGISARYLHCAYDDGYYLDVYSFNRGGDAFEITFGEVGLPGSTILSTFKFIN